MTTQPTAKIEDALGDAPTRGDYSDRLGEGYQPHQGAIPQTAEQMATDGDEVAEAQALYEALQERVRDGDESVTVDELERARGLSLFARLRVEAGQRKETARRQAAARDGVKDAVRAASAVSTETKDLQALETKAEKALAAYLSACQDRRTAVKTALAGLSSADAAATVEGVDGVTAAGVTLGDYDATVPGKDGPVHLDLRAMGSARALMPMLKRLGIGVNGSEVRQAGW